MFKLRSNFDVRVCSASDSTLNIIVIFPWLQLTIAATLWFMNLLGHGSTFYQFMVQPTLVYDWNGASNVRALFQHIFGVSCFYAITIVICVYVLQIFLAIITIIWIAFPLKATYWKQAHSHSRTSNKTTLLPIESANVTSKEVLIFVFS